jgi:hypothetical protein
LTPGKIKIRIRYEHPGSYFRKLRNSFGLNIFIFFDADADPDPGSRNLFDPGWKKFGSGIRDKHSGSITLFEKIIVLEILLICNFADQEKKIKKFDQNFGSIRLHHYM